MSSKATVNYINNCESLLIVSCKQYSAINARSHSPDSQCTVWDANQISAPLPPSWVQILARTFLRVSRLPNPWPSLAWGLPSWIKAASCQYYDQLRACLARCWDQCFKILSFLKNLTSIVFPPKNLKTISHFFKCFLKSMFNINQHWLGLFSLCSQCAKHRIINYFEPAPNVTWNSLRLV